MSSLPTREIEEVLVSMGLPVDALEVNKLALDDAFQKHPSMVAVAASCVAGARRHRDELKLNLARTVSLVRREQVDTGRKVLAKDLELAVDADPEVRKAEKLVIAADQRIAQCDAVLQGLQAKTSALKHLSELYQAAYYVSDSSSRDPRVRNR